MDSPTSNPAQNFSNFSDHRPAHVDDCERVVILITATVN
jgi:hypothetical protein